MFTGPLNRPKGKQLENKIHLFEKQAPSGAQTAKKHKAFPIR
jgi:hypothetical protein